MDDLWDTDDNVERVLWVAPPGHEVGVYKVPPMQGASGHRCQDWADKDFMRKARVKVLAKGDALTVRLEDDVSGEWSCSLLGRMLATPRSCLWAATWSLCPEEECLPL